MLYDIDDLSWCQFLGFMAAGVGLLVATLTVLGYLVS